MVREKCYWWGDRAWAEIWLLQKRFTEQIQCFHFRWLIFQHKIFVWAKWKWEREGKEKLDKVINLHNECVVLLLEIIFSPQWWNTQQNTPETEHESKKKVNLVKLNFDWSSWIFYVENLFIKKMWKFRSSWN